MRGSGEPIILPEETEEDVPETMEHYFTDLQTTADDQFEYAVRMIQVNVVHGGREILKNINWNVRKGERWALMGHNGSRKNHAVESGHRR